jgi:hypothetical protein
MVVPSASGSLKGTPTSMMSATSAAERSAAALSLGLGNPAVRYGTRAVRPDALRAVHTGASRDSDEVIANREPESGGVSDLHDGAPVVARFIALGDGGTGTLAQYQVAAAAKTVCDQKGCDFALYLGDNIYEVGVYRGTNTFNLVKELEQDFTVFTTSPMALALIGLSVAVIISSIVVDVRRHRDEFKPSIKE